MTFVNPTGDTCHQQWRFNLWYNMKDYIDFCYSN